MTALRMAAVAAEFGRDLEEDFQIAERLVKEAREEDVRLLALPEACLGGYLLSLDDDTELDGGPPALALDGPEIRRLAALAGEMTVVAGYCEAGADGRRYNSVVCVTGDGVLGNHRKVHQPLSEDASYASGDRFHAFDTPAGRIGMMICYDKAFPESARALALDGAQIGVCVSAWPGSRTNAAASLEEDRWKRRFDLFDRARALENQIVWLSANQSGTFGSLRFVGSAKVVDPGGEILADTGVTAGIAVAELDVVQALDTARRSMGHLRDRRPETYDLSPGAVSA
ncbi:putative amidohydrolase [Streptomyces umbrinus]|uniref:carbon-nitrogen hydrolase family protein n=1 Tax=Streptomyces umbrinus TaxID=67370 RepID=UPI00167D67CE|nr:carbon-nitrogen hydrolase family protein [Streptomyces umbrinus]MCR3728200.1 putative amidohydrolase [Streptomyces umbrinus]GHH35923.1 apolipoprotein N-acyltransferase [Streptomyces umbrinus]